MTATTYAGARVLAVRFSGRGVFHLFAGFDGGDVVAECGAREDEERASIREGRADCRKCEAARVRATRAAIRAANETRLSGRSVVTGARGVVVALARAGSVVRPAAGEMAVVCGGEDEEG